MDEQREFILDYIYSNPPVSAMDKVFHDEFHKRFGGKRNHKCYGASPVLKAQRLLNMMWCEGDLERRIVPVPACDNPPGYPTWVYGYS